MSKYYKAEDITELISACEWRMTLAKERHGEGFVDYSKQVLDVDELTKRLLDLPTIEFEEGAWITACNSYEIICSNCESEAFSDDGEYVKTNFCPDCGARMRG